MDTRKYRLLAVTPSIMGLALVIGFTGCMSANRPWDGLRRTTQGRPSDQADTGLATSSATGSTSDDPLAPLVDRQSAQVLAAANRSLPVVPAAAPAPAQSERTASPVGQPRISELAGQIQPAHPVSLVRPETNFDLRDIPPQRFTSRGKVEHVSEGTFRQDVLEVDAPVLVDFYADWCGPCKKLAPVLDRVARNNTNAKIVKVNIDRNPALAASYRVESIPTLLVFRDGSVVARHKGLADAPTIERLLK